MSLSLFLQLPLYCGLMFFPAMELAAQTGNSPTVIIIYPDDYGYTDLGLFGRHGDVDAANTHALASKGALMTNGYCSAPRCRPSGVESLSCRLDRLGFDS